MSDKPVWYCDPQKNEACKKSGCYLFGGPCHLTLSVKNAIILNGRPMEGPRWHGDKSAQEAET